MIDEEALNSLDLATTRAHVRTLIWDDTESGAFLDRMSATELADIIFCLSESIRVFMKVGALSPSVVRKALDD